MTRARDDSSRRGPGRPRLPDAERGRTVSIVLPARVLEEIDAVAELAGISRSTWVRRLIERSLRARRRRED